MSGARGCLTGTSRRWVIGILLVLIIVSCAPLVPMLFSYYLVWHNVDRRCGFSVLADDIAWQCLGRGTSDASALHRPVIVTGNEDADGVPADVERLGGNYVVPVFPGGWGNEKPAQTILETADFGDTLTIMKFSGPLTVIVHTLRPRTDPVRLVSLRRSAEYLRHIEKGAVVLIVKTHECLGCIPDKLIREVGRLELWDFFPRSPLALYSTNALIYGRQRTSDVSYGF